MNSQASDALSEDLLRLCRSASLSEDSLREIFERHGLRPGNNIPSNSNYTFFHGACLNEIVNEGILRCLLEHFPAAVSATDDDGHTPLHFVCWNKNVTLGIVQLLTSAVPDSVRCVDNDGRMPLHYVCGKNDINENEGIKILKLFLEKYPESVRHAENGGNLPLHLASRARSPEFCRVLIEAYPGSEQISNEEDGFLLPLHCACAKNTLATVEYLYKVYPDAFNAAADGLHPIHCAIAGMIQRNSPTSVVHIVQFLLDCNPNVEPQKFQGLPLLWFACGVDYDDSNIDAGLQVIKTIYDEHPEAIEEDQITSFIQLCHEQVQTFINDELVYARQANDHRLMMTPDEKGQLPLHRALQNNVRLGSIKLLVKGNPAAIGNADNNGILPLHLACQYHDSPCVVKYLLSQDTRRLGEVDFDTNTVLHYACKGAKYDTIALLLEDYDATSVSKRNAQEKLPIDLVWESEEVKDRESVEYMDSVFRLLKAYPETVMNYNINRKRKLSDSDK